MNLDPDCNPGAVRKGLHNGPGVLYFKALLSMFLPSVRVEPGPLGWRFRPDISHTAVSGSHSLTQAATSPPPGASGVPVTSSPEEYVSITVKFCQMKFQGQKKYFTCSEAIFTKLVSS